MANETDLRIIKTREAIHSSFEALTKKQPLAKLTVAELCREARIGKKTFYRHYPTLGALAQEYLDALVSEFFAETEGLVLPEHTAEFVRQLMVFMCDRGNADATTECIFCGLGSEKISRDIVSHATELDRINTRKFGRLSAAEISLVLMFAASTTVNMYRQWVAEGKHLSPKRLSEMAQNLTSSEASLRK